MFQPEVLVNQMSSDQRVPSFLAAVIIGYCTTIQYILPNFLGDSIHHDFLIP